MASVRVLTLNLWGRHGDWARRSRVIADGLHELDPDLIAFQEAFVTAEHDTVAELLEAGYHVVHQRLGLLGDGNCAAIASRPRVLRIEEVDLHVTPRTADFPVTAMVAEVDSPVGPLLFVNHKPSWRPELERERELQARAAARRIDELALPVVLAGDLDAAPDSPSVCFWRDLGYVDAWESARPGEPGPTFEGRRIDYVLVRGLRVAACAPTFAEGGASDHAGVLADLVSR